MGDRPGTAWDGRRRTLWKACGPSLNRSGKSARRALEQIRSDSRSDLDQRFLHDAAGLAEIHASRVALLQRRHDTAHVLHAGGAELADDALDGRAHVGLVHLLRQEALDDLDLLAFADRKSTRLNSSH